MNICYSVAYNRLVCFYYSDWITSADRKYKYMGYSLKRAKQEFRRAAHLERVHINFIEISA